MMLSNGKVAKMPDKLTDKDIIKALECCTTTGLSCKDCPAFVKVDRSNCKKYFRGAIDLINRQQAEIERLHLLFESVINSRDGYIKVIEKYKAENERLKAKCENTQIGYNFAQDEIKTLKKDKYKLQKALNQSEDYRVIAKAEAYKEFAEMLIDKAKNGVIQICDLPDYVKEMVGENE